MERFDIYDLQEEADLRVSVTVLFLGVLVIVGLLTRFSGLGDRPLARDEYYFVRSVENILEFGVPRFGSGGYYVRGILLQYLTAISIFLFGDGGFAYRFPSALFGVGTLVMAYFLGRRFLNRSWSILLVALLTFSSWEIEFSRFARMYAAFGFMAVCFFWSLYRYSFSGTSHNRYLAVVFALMAILTHELGVFVAICLFLPLPGWFDGDWRRGVCAQRYYIAISLIVLLIGLFLAQYPFRTIGVSDPLPEGFMRGVSEVPYWLSFGTGLLGGFWFISIGALSCAGLVGWYSRIFFRLRSIVSLEEQILGGVLVLALCGAVFHQFAISAVGLLIVALRDPAVLVKRRYLSLLGLLAVIVAVWSALFLFEYVWLDGVGHGTTARAYVRLFRRAFFSFPDLYIPVVKAWSLYVPMLGCLLGVAVVSQVIRIRRLPLASMVRNPVIPILIVLFGFGMFPPYDIETRYSHFLYPLLLCVGLVSASRGGEILNRGFIRSETSSKVLAITLCLFLFSMSEDVNAFHVLHPNSDSITYRLGRYEVYSRHWYPRWDFRGAAELVNGAFCEGEKIIVMASVNTIAAYSKPDFVIYWPREDSRFTLISREGGTRELWSGRRLLSTPEDVIEYTHKAGSVWLVLYPGWGSLDPEALWPGRVRNVEVFVAGRDKRIEVWKIELRKMVSSPHRR